MNIVFIIDNGIIYDILQMEEIELQHKFVTTFPRQLTNNLYLIGFLWRWVIVTEKWSQLQLLICMQNIVSVSKSTRKQ